MSITFNYTIIKLYHKIYSIERLWRDLWDGCICLFYTLFCMMEDRGILLPGNEVDLKALHYIYLPRIQQHLDMFRNAFIRRPLRTANNRTPLQLWISGLTIDPRTDLNMVLTVILSYFSFY